MLYFADLHVHSKYAYATSRSADLKHHAMAAQRKGIAVLGTGDFTHPAWYDQLREQLTPAEPGLYRLRKSLERELTLEMQQANLLVPGSQPIRFLLQVEISTIYKHGSRTRKIHHLIYVPDFRAARKFITRLSRIGNLHADGRPILGIRSRDLLELTLESSPAAYLIPAHIWTPWFGVLGSQSGYDDLEECYGDLTDHIFALETGLSSDPAMNRTLSALDRYQLVSNSDAHSSPKIGREATCFNADMSYFAIKQAVETGAGLVGTVEFFPEEGKYHHNGHRKCNISFSPAETDRIGGICPVCNRPLTLGVLHRVHELADRKQARSQAAHNTRYAIPLVELLAELLEVGPQTKTVLHVYNQILSQLGPELDVLLNIPLADLAKIDVPRLREAIARMRAGQVRREAGYDGHDGTIEVLPLETNSEQQAKTQLATVA